MTQQEAIEALAKVRDAFPDNMQLASILSRAIFSIGESRDMQDRKLLYELLALNR